jgi:hypothetical protein
MFDIVGNVENSMSFSIASISLDDFSQLNGLEKINEYLFVKKINRSKTLLLVPKKSHCQVAMVKTS